ncbi:MAG: NNMT/PNMT/TEMT family class I SAM-dependent methyltransferase [Chloroflexi bacterium]|nr:NNMT/PNMT/TEMT family class I SAM-dependent methyltransferase [Chloroflexota bacterium]
MTEFATYNAFDPLAYLNAYYSEIGTEADGLMTFLVEVFAGLEHGVSVLEFGGGPTIIGMIAAAPRASEIHFCDYVDANRAVVQKWLDGQDEDFDWTPFIKRTLQLEGVSEPGGTDIAERSQQLRNVVTRVVPCDLYQSPPVETDQLYDVVTAHYCLDAVTNDKNEWHGHIQAMKALLKPGGTFIMSSLHEAQFSDFGGTRFPNVYLQQEDVSEALLQAGFIPSSIIVSAAPADHAQREYSGVIFASAVQS